MADLSGKVAVVTGAASGIGYALADETGMEPAEVARQVFRAVGEDRFWVLPNAEGFGPAIKEVAASAVEGRTPPLVQS
jgi:NAD(P)-dependent dehydrogenase (short-subunit alcohol dehydrogenase family)